MIKRPEDFTDPQPAPRYRPGHASMHDLAAVLHQYKGAGGFLKYRSKLQAFNGRNTAIDKVQESMDRLVYELAEVIERQAIAEGVEYLDDRIAKWQQDGVAIEPSFIRSIFEEALSEKALVERTEVIAAQIVATCVPEVSDGA